MFGYVTVNRPEMKVKELELYRSYYCGLCHALHERYGPGRRLFLSYDGTFLAILLTGLYEPKEREQMRRCVVHPVVKHREKENRYIAYAADMNLMLAYRKAADDWTDEKSIPAAAAAKLLKGDYGRLRARYPRQERALAENIRALRRMEAEELKASADGESSGAEQPGDVWARIERAAGYTGNFFGELCVPHRDRWERDLRMTGFYLGKFIYLMDAYDDLEEDGKKGNFNVLSALKRLDEPHFDEAMKEILLDTAACCCRSFERLPIVTDVELLRNILYSGIWVAFHRIRAGEKDSKNRTAWCEDA